MFSFYAKTPLYSEENQCFHGITFDGRNYYLTIEGNERIIKLDRNLQLRERILCSRVYQALCYDCNDGCFWGASGKPSKLFKLNRAFQDIGQLELAPLHGEISGLAYSSFDNALILSTEDKILWLDKNDTQNIQEIECAVGKYIKGVTAIPLHFLYHFVDETQKIRIIANGGSLIEEFCPPTGYIIKQALFRGRRGNFYYFQMLALKKNGNPYLLEGRLEKHLLDEICPDRDFGSSNKCFNQNTSNNHPSADYACNCNCDCNCDCNCNCNCDCGCNSNCNCDGQSSGNNSINESNYCCNCSNCCNCNDCCNYNCNCDNGCDKTRENQRPCSTYCPYSSPPSPCQGLNALFNSFATEEAALAHILHAEGDRLHNVIANCSCLAGISEVNKDVRNTLVEVSRLEQLLYDKLNTVCQHFHCCNCQSNQEGSDNINCREASFSDK